MHKALAQLVPSVAEWILAPESDAGAGGESPVRAPVRAATLCPYVYLTACVFVAGTAQRPESVSGRRGPCPLYTRSIMNVSRARFTHSRQNGTLAESRSEEGEFDRP